MWYKVEEKVPNKTTRYASTYGVNIIGIDMSEPNPTPHDVLYMYVQGFVECCSNSDWTPSCITHWTEMPERPIIKK